jgi:hypothetical protein
LLLKEFDLRGNSLEFLLDEVIQKLKDQGCEIVSKLYICYQLVRIVKGKKKLKDRWKV